MRTTAALALALFAASPTLAADKVDWAPCQTEIAKWCSTARDKGGEEGLYQCLLKRDADLSTRCDNEAHSKYEKLTGRAK
jgi:hypothetical protein